MRTIAKDAEDFTYQQLQKWASGEEPRLDNLRRIEVALDPERMAGWLLRAAGYVDDPTSLEEAIEADPRLEATDVRALKIALRMHLGEEQP